MKAMNSLATLALTAYAVLVLAACSKTSNDSNPAAATPAAACTISFDGTYRNAQGQPCSGTGTTTCPANGYYNGANGAYTQCTPGQAITYSSPNSNYPYSSYPSSGCDGWTQEYQQQYVPIYLNGQLVCANYADLIGSLQSSQQYSYYQSTPYYNNPEYYYAYPPYSYGNSGGGGSGFSICAGGSSGSFSAGGCLNF